MLQLAAILVPCTLSPGRPRVWGVGWASSPTKVDGGLPSCLFLVQCKLAELAPSAELYAHTVAHGMERVNADHEN
jgi:hypothetical protein